MMRPLLLSALLLATAPALAGKKDKEPAATPPAAAAPTTASAGDASGAATIAVDYRHEVFGGLGKHMKALGFFVKSKLDPRREDLVAHATALRDLGLVLPHLFPAGTGPDAVPQTEALAAIWTDPQGFAERIQAFQAETATLAELAAGDDFEAFKVQYGKVGGTCGACHDSYRKPDEH